MLKRDCTVYVKLQVRNELIRYTLNFLFIYVKRLKTCLYFIKDMFQLTHKLLVSFTKQIERRMILSMNKRV